MPVTETLSRVKSVIRACLKIDEAAPLADSMPLVGGEYEVDSLDILLIVTQLEKEFGVKVTEGNLRKAAFTNIETLGAFIDELRRTGQAA